MPRGFKIVDWTDPSNDAKLLVSVLKHVEVSKHYAEIAKDFGEDVPAQCIQLRVSKIKRTVKDGKPLHPGAKGSIGKGATNGNKGNVGSRGKKPTVNHSEDDSMEDEDISLSQSMTPPKTPTGFTSINKTVSGRVTKARGSPRKKAKKDHKEMEEPFMDIKDVKVHNGHSMFHDEKSEGSDNTDVEFGQERATKVEYVDDAI